MGNSNQVDNERTQEKGTGHAVKISLDNIDKVKKCICKINYQKNNDRTSGTGFFMLVNDIKYIITNYHIISERLININIIIQIYNKKKFIIKLNNRKYKFFRTLDITTIELNNSDDILNHIDFLDYDLNYIKGYEKYTNKDVFTLQYPMDSIELASGKILKVINNYEFKHNLDTEFGSSGSPIILHNSLLVIGIHKESDNKEKVNYGSFIGEIIKANNENNYIIGEIYITKDNIGKNIRIINSYDEYCRKSNLSEKNIKENFRNERELKESLIIEINNIKISFSYFYKFQKEGRYNIKYIFNSPINNCYMLFYKCTCLTNLNLSKFHTQNVTNMFGMFWNCSSLINIDLSDVSTKNVINMNNMFKDCSSLNNLDLSSFNTENVKYMNGMFQNCYSLISLNLSNFNTENVIYMNDMFNNCSSLINLNILNFNTENVNNMGGMFSGCSSLIYLDISNFNTENVAIMNDMFSGCSSLLNLDLSNFNTQNVSSMLNMFSNCSSLYNLNILYFNTENVYNMQGIFNNCKAYETKTIITNDSKIFNLMNE
jgi:surface protein